MKKWLLCASVSCVLLLLPAALPEIDGTGPVRMNFWANACAVAAPEIDATGAMTAFGLLAGAVALVAERLRRR